MHLRVITYTAGRGGIPRFIVELLKALNQSRPGARIEFVSHGQCLREYRDLFRVHCAEVETRDARPPGYWHTAPGRIFGIRGTGALLQALAGSVTKWGFEIPPELLNGCDAVLLPFLQAHHASGADVRHIVATFHDMLGLKPLGGFLKPARRGEHALLTRMFDSEVRIVTSSQTTASVAAELFHLKPGRMRVVPLSGGHDWRSLRPFTPEGWKWASRHFIFCPAILSPYKNHRALFQAAAEVDDRYPVVLTGSGADLPRYLPLAMRLRRLAKRCGLQIGTDILALGYVTDDIYYGLLQKCWALVMPTLVEGGGSFPVEEAVLEGVPVVCSDIPVMREHMQRLGAEVLWFNPHDPTDLAAKLVDLKCNYSCYKQRALSQVSQIKRRSWADVATEYWQIIDEAARV